MDALKAALGSDSARASKGVQPIEDLVLRRARFVFLLAGAAEGTAAFDLFQNVLVALILVLGAHH